MLSVHWQLYSKKKIMKHFQQRYIIASFDSIVGTIFNLWVCLQKCVRYSGKSCPGGAGSLVFWVGILWICQFSSVKIAQRYGYTTRKNEGWIAACDLGFHWDWSKMVLRSFPGSIATWVLKGCSFVYNLNEMLW